VDKDASTVTDLGRRLLDPVSAAGVHFQGLVGQLGGLSSLHNQALTGTGDVVTVTSAYGQIIGAVLDLDQALTPQLGDPGLTGLALSLNNLEIAQEQVRLQQTIVTIGIAHGSLLNTELSTVQSSDVLLTDRLNNFQIGASPNQLDEFQQAAITNDLNNREQLAQQVLANGLTLMVVGNTGQGANSLGVAPGSWISASDAAAGQLTKVAGELADALKSTSANLKNQASSAAVTESVILLAILLLAVGVGVVVGRHLLRSLGILRRTALDVAEYRLPEVVASIDAGDLTDLSIEPVPVHTHEELGQLARAFDAVHGQAVRSAVGQATLRSNLRNIFVNLSRRSQGLVERQLRLMERLERNEENPEQLANLFKLDHLATRMRRNNENLMVLSGDDPARRSGGPVPLADVVRAAVSEIEHYQRVVVRSTPSMDVLGYAAGDLTRLIAELLDNATSFSPPQSRCSSAAGTSPTARYAWRSGTMASAWQRPHWPTPTASSTRGRARTCRCPARWACMWWAGSPGGSRSRWCWRCRRTADSSRWCGCRPNWSSRVRARPARSRPNRRLTARSAAASRSRPRATATDTTVPSTDTPPTSSRSGPGSAGRRSAISRPP